MKPWLPADVARCRPGCAARRDTCGRFLAPLPKANASVVDGAQLHPYMACPLYIAASTCTPPAAPARRVHPRLGS